ncbi:hypothetical protein EVAR_89344_1 [Eumeta japonica]|uniref:Uncharacterized protein n=1 Tax=Eumeta variegata TaxID=151549 RepID=A0A4C1Y2U3_EUMVA|nr:hypothetical protein EVAR_89344_1 [Eumeta japonica]
MEGFHVLNKGNIPTFADSPYCACAPDKVHDLPHVLKECPIFVKESAETEAGTAVQILRENFPDLLSEDKICQLFLTFCERVTGKISKMNGSTARY